MDSKDIAASVCFIIALLSTTLAGTCPPKCRCESATAKVLCRNKNILKWNNRIEKNTTVVDLRNNKFTTCPALSQYKNLQTVILSNNLLTSVNQTCFNESAVLKHLDLSYNKLTTIPNMTGGAEVRTLNLTANQILELKTIAIYGLSQLRVLILDNNGLAIFSGEELLQHDDRLEVLSLRNNNIKCFCSDLNARLFSSAISLRELYVSNNTLVERNSKWLIGASNLKVLDLRAAYCSFNYSVENADEGWEFPGHSESLFSLDLSQNRLHTFGLGAFSGCKNLKSVNLTNCSLAEFQPGQLEDIKKVNYLYIDHNSISNITPTLFFGLSELKVLSMEQNKLHSSTLSELYLGNMHDLETINFKNNNIKNLDFLDKVSFNNLSTLLLDNNQLSRIRNLNKFTSLKVVSLRNNSLNFIPNINKLTKLERVNLAQNNISVLDFDNFWLTSSSVTINLTGNKITTVKRGLLNTLSDYQTTWSVNLMDNPLRCLCSEKWFKEETQRLEYNSSLLRLYENIRFDCPGANDMFFNISYALEKTECLFIHRDVLIVLGCIILLLVCCAILAIGMTMGKRLERRQRTNTGGGRMQTDSEKKLASDFNEKRTDHSPSFMVAEKDQHLKDAISLSNLKGSMVRLDNENLKPFFREIYV
ncbi:Carboxypeptidase N subunit 2 [Holothuria leucospilota]|uniref:Carboxypeptidase N subunit 2 n=1 Tax=Holothuria leucospilota TaxID=206669 RepID=A0A9Q1BM03_HOLLE|nr:Carboxypeptidase N subunit 2 [Holothuria leucospilota]